MSSPDAPDPRSSTVASSFGRSGLGPRAFSTLALWTLVVGVFLWGHAFGFILLIGGLTLLGTWEYHLITRRAGVLPMPKLGLIGASIYTAALYYLLLHGRQDETHLLDGMALAAFTGLAFFLHLRLPVEGQRPIIALAVTLLGFVYLAIGMNFTGRVLFFDYPGSGKPAGAWLALWLVAVTKFTDMGAYLVGTAIGKKKLIPHISPGKTREGLIGAFGASQAIGCGLYALFPSQLALLGGWNHVVILGFLIAFAAIIGDLAESLFKRGLATKDSGHTLPGIGGVLDLIDSLIFSAPLLYFYLRWLHFPPVFHP
jgi:phosphatidate cytidylyltransferase